MRHFFLWTLFAALIVQTITACKKPGHPTLEKKSYVLVWQDEFNYSGMPDSTKWSYDTAGNASGWGNNEMEYYTAHRKENAWVDSGTLKIRAILEKYAGRDYTSARLVTKQKGDWLYGKIDVRAKLPGGVGCWPAIWMLPTDWDYGGWPESGEIDIMEQVGFNPDTVFASIHTQTYNHVIGTQKTRGTFIEKSSTEFHDYSLEWQPDTINIFLDGRKYFTFSNEHTGFNEWPFDKRFHLLLNIAVGGNWGGVKGIDRSKLPYIMAIDYVRVYQR